MFSELINLIERNYYETMNKWKIAFWVCLVFFIISGLFYYLTNEISIGFMKDNTKCFKEDLAKIIIIINKDLKTKKQIEDEFRENGYSPFTYNKGDTASLFRTDFIFKNDTLVKIIGRDY